MKKILKILTVALIILIFCVLILFCIKIDKISLIENIREKIAKTEELEQNINEVTIIDVTDLEDNGNLKHEHIFKTMYDENKHWEECTICGNKENEQNHSFTRTWTLGYESCMYTNYYTDVCSCGCKIIDKKPCVWNGTTYMSESGNQHSKYCSNCKTRISGKYYYNGILCESSGYEACADANGNKITCITAKTCSKCKAYRAINGHDIQFNGERNEIYCKICNTVYGTVSYKVESDLKTPATYTFDANVRLTNGAKFDKIGGIRNVSGVFASTNQNLKSGGYGSTNINVVTTGKFNNTYKNNYSVYVYIYTIINQRSFWTYITPEFKISPDSTKPIILDISNGDNSLTEWSKTKPIIVSGIESYCNTVTVQILDEQGNNIYIGDGVVSGNNYSISCIPELEVNTNGKKFKAIITDACGNSTEKEFTIAKVDSIPPTATSSDNITGEWAKSRKFKFTATDYGIGNVSIAFNDIKDLELANFDETEYSRDYEFYGDVYKSKQLSVLYKDGLGNAKIQKITIDKLDNTAPSITNATLHNNKLIIESHDRHESLGEGSGVTKYRYLASEGKLENLELTNENSIEMMKDEEIIIQDIYKMKYIYLLAEDLVGNISEVYEFEVPNLELTSTVNLNTTNGKGEIILDWSSYNIEDKYFVVYRKRENETEWKTIVSLEEKLTGSTHTDILANDEANPSTPNITITGDVENNNINITANSSDNGTKYKYYIEAYDKTENILLKISNKS